MEDLNYCKINKPSVLLTCSLTLLLVSTHRIYFLVALYSASAPLVAAGNEFASSFFGLLHYI